jgi:hypothetical protein
LAPLDSWLTVVGQIHDGAISSAVPELKRPMDEMVGVSTAALGSIHATNRSCKRWFS